MTPLQLQGTSYRGGRAILALGRAGRAKIKKYKKCVHVWCKTFQMSHCPLPYLPYRPIDSGKYHLYDMMHSPSFSCCKNYEIMISNHSNSKKNKIQTLLLLPLLHFSFDFGKSIGQLFIEMRMSY